MPASPVVSAETYVKRFPGFAQAILLMCDDGEAYVAKAIDVNRADVTRRSITAEHLVARLGTYLGAAVPAVTFVDIPVDLVHLEPQLATVQPGLAHGLKLVANCTGRTRIMAASTPEHRVAYARLAVLYGWLHAGDAQLIWTQDRSRNVHSVDHGHFLPGGPNWTCESLASDGTCPSAPHPRLAQFADSLELLEAVELLRALTDQDVGKAVGWTRAEWGLPIDDLVALARFAARRRDEFEQ